MNRVTRSLLWVLLAAACGAGAGATRPSGGWKVVDLTHSLGGEIPVFPGGAPPEIKSLATVEKDGYYANLVTIGEHAGTHVDAPAHFAAGQAPVDKLPPEWLVQRAAVIDVSLKVGADPDYLLDVPDLIDWEKAHGRMGQGTCVLVRTGWSDRWPDEKMYRNTDGKGAMRFPGVALGASRYLLERGVRCIGIDTLSTDPGLSKTYDQHKHFLAGGGYHLENLTNLDQLPPTGATIVVGVLPVQGGSGAPARVLALIPR